MRTELQMALPLEIMPFPAAQVRRALVEQELGPPDAPGFPLAGQGNAVRVQSQTLLIKRSLGLALLVGQAANALLRLTLAVTVSLLRRAPRSSDAFDLSVRAAVLSLEEHR